ncbi:MAG: hypothetical protein JW774_01080, partial [Candidatus Aureabacteria bacterium]|nr:hypothetical protein [Candidatus Auribacterota bacterium]
QWSNQVSTLHSALDDILAMQNAGFTLKKDTLDKIMAWEQKMRRYDSAHARIAQIIRNHRYYARKHFVLHDWEQRDASHKPALSVLSRLTTSQAVESFARKHQGVPALRKYVLIRKLELVVEDKYMLRQMLEWLNLLLPPNEVEAAENNPMIQLCLRDEVSVCLHGAEDTLQLLLTFAVHTRVRGQGNQRRFMIEFNELFKKIAVHFQDQFDREKIQGLMALIGYQIRNTSSFMTLTSLNHFVDFLFDVSTNIQSRHHSRTFTLPQLLSALTALNSLIFDPDSLNTEIISLQMILDGCIDDFESMEDVVAAMYILWEAQKGNDYILLDQRGVDAAMLSAQLKTRRESREQPRPEQVELDPTVRAA